MSEQGKRIRMRIYKVHDFDLLIYYESLRDKSLGNPKVSFSTMMRNLLTDYCKTFIMGEAGTPFKGPPGIDHLYSGKLRSSIYVRFTVTDPDVMKMLDSIQPRQVNSFLKNLLRRYMALDLFNMGCYFNQNIELKPVAAPAAKKETYKAKERKNKSEVNHQVKIPIPDEIIPELIIPNEPDYINPVEEKIREVPEAITVPEQETIEPAVENLKAENKTEEKEPAEDKEEKPQEFDLFSALGSIMQ